MVRGRKTRIFVFNLMSKGSYIQYGIRQYVVLKSDKALVYVGVESGVAAGGSRTVTSAQRNAPDRLVLRVGSCPTSLEQYVRPILFNKR